MEGTIISIKIPKRCKCGNTNSYIRGEVYEGKIIARVTCMKCGVTYQAYNLDVTPSPTTSEKKEKFRYHINLDEWR